MRRLVSLVVPPAVALLAACGGNTSDLTAPAAKGPAYSRADDARNGPSVFNTQLRAENEVAPTVTTSVAKASAQIKVGQDDVITFQLVVHNPAGEQFVAAHIHRGAVDANGPVVAEFDIEGVSGAERAGKQIVLRGVAVPRPGVDPARLAARLRSEPELYYVNAHTTASPAGAVRGQLR